LGRFFIVILQNNEIVEGEMGMEKDMLDTDFLFGEESPEKKSRFSNIKDRLGEIDNPMEGTDILIDDMVFNTQGEFIQKEKSKAKKLSQQCFLL